MDDTSLITVLKAISQPTRLAILRKVAAHQGQLGAECHQGVTCSAVLADLGVSQSTFSHHISELAAVGLVTMHPSGKFMILEINRPVWDEFQKALPNAIFG